jgi:hypothetical protein
MVRILAMCFVNFNSNGCSLIAFAALRQAAISERPCEFAQRRRRHGATSSAGRWRRGNAWLAGTDYY